MARKLVLISGGASGIGLAAAKVMARKGWLPVIADRDTAALAQASHVLSEAGDEFLSMELDVTDREQCVSRIASLGETHGPISALVTCAGITLDTRLSQPDAAAGFDRAIGVNLTGVFNTISAAADQLRSTRGAVVTVSSVVSLTSGFYGAGYVASKGGINALTRQFARELAPDGVRVNAVAPGFIETPMVKSSPELDRWLAFHCPAGRLGKPEEVARVIEFLVSDSASFVSGVILPVDGGYLTI